MEFFRLRPQATFGITFFFCSLAASYHEVSRFFVTALSVPFLAVLLYSAVNRRRADADRRQSLTALLALFLAPVAAFGLAAYRGHRVQDTVPYDGAVTAVAAVRTRLVSSGGYSQYILDVRSAGGEEVHFRAAVGGYGLSLGVGDVISAEATFAPVGDSYEDGGRYLRSRGALAEAQLSEIRYSGRDTSAVYLVGALREEINARIDANMDENAGLMCALVTGERSNLAPELRKSFSDIGIPHLLAISGLHMGVLISAAAFFVRYLGRKKYFVLIPAILLYAALSGFSSSAVRAGTMAVICCIAELAGRRTDTVSVISLAVVIIIAVSPGAIYDTGFLLSVLCVLALAVFPGFIKTAEPGRHAPAALPRRVLRAVTSSVAATVAVSVVTLPVTAREFGTLSLIAPLSNLVFIPLFSVLIGMAPVFVLSCFIPFLGKAVGAAADLYAGLLIRLVRWFGAVGEDFVVSLGYPFFGVLSVLLAVSFALACIAGRRRRRRYALLAVLLVIAMAGSAAGTELRRVELVSISAGAGKEGDLIAVTQGSSLYIIDSARPVYSFRRRVTEAMRTACAPRIHTYVFTHYHPGDDVYLRRLLAGISVGEVVLPFPQNEDERDLCLSMAQTALDSGCVPRLAEEETALGALTLTQSWRCRTAHSTESICVLSLSLGDERFTYLSAGYFDVGEAFRSMTQDMLCGQTVLGSHGLKDTAALPSGDIPENITPLAEGNGASAVWEMPDSAISGGQGR